MAANVNYLELEPKLGSSKTVGINVGRMVLAVCASASCCLKSLRTGYNNKAMLN